MIHETLHLCVSSSYRVIIQSFIYKEELFTLDMEGNWARDVRKRGDHYIYVSLLMDFI